MAWSEPAARAEAGERLVLLAEARHAPAIAVVGTMKNAGKTVTFGAICAALERRGVRYAAVSIGRDGERVDALTTTPKPRIRLAAGTTFATAESRVPAHPAAVVLRVTDERAAIGRVAIARTVAACEVELAGPATADGLRRIVRELAVDGTFVVLDGAIDRLSALRDGGEAIVVAAGASGMRSVREAALAAGALVRRLGLPLLDEDAPQLTLDGALTPSAASALVRAGEARQVVVADATRVAFGGATFLALARHLNLRVRRALRPIACTIAPSGPGASFDPAALLDAVAEATGLPTYDVYAARSRGDRSAA